MLWSLSPGTIVGEVLCVAGNLVFAKQIGFGFASRTWWCLFWPVCSKLLSGFAHECSEAWSHLARANGRFDWWQRPGQLGQFSSAHQLGQKSGRVKELKSLLHLVASCCILLHTVASLCYFGNMMFMACVQNETKFFTMVYGPASCCILLHPVASCCILLHIFAAVPPDAGKPWLFNARLFGWIQALYKPWFGRKPTTNLQ